MANRSKQKTDERVTKRRVTMKSSVALPNGQTGDLVATDYVLPEELDAYVADAQTRWQVVTVSDEPDAGPGGYGGQTVTMDGTVRPAEKG